MNTRIPLLTLALVMIGCAHSAPTSGGAVSPSDLNAAPEQYRDKTVVVEGFLTLVPEAHNLYQSKALKAEFERRWDADDPAFDPKAYQAYCLTIANPDALTVKRELLDGTTITVKGKFLADYLVGKIDLGACPLPTAIVIDVDDLRRRYPSIFTN
ncbi:hypothetical protein ABRP17_009675 [Stenotrophomonas sp. WHRI 8082]|uniref:hypothetical protein n=1 Tax=Stenotrophomonas sp. WHRI 8082 TaxID=3162571 RepID=UPI0032EC2B97